MDQGILIRRASNFRGLDDSYIRLAIKSRELNIKLIEALTCIEKMANDIEVNK